ncbi:hypothetical protein NEMBOFW57_008000 [Staphylotrichum longicolle]|uniref:Aminoglycoside phosphotransferase domain-containing protein n=1 Tax=Staphylotrichum longicolle TaxID=669026 RepID=A0AAD4HVG8_9PEZI|nr:hypothetical protein NEMBOFW57_008000 [Staphylotrichum longicolle]
MLYVSNKTQIRVPRVYAIYQEEDFCSRMCTYIVMELVSGFDELRSLDPPGGFGSLRNRPLYDGLFLTDDERPTISGPFQFETEIAEALVLKLQHEDDKFPSERAAYYRHVLPQVLQGDGRPRFTRADLQTKNIMLQPDGGLVILDWQSAGWA